MAAAAVIAVTLVLWSGREPVASETSHPAEEELALEVVEPLQRELAAVAEDVNSIAYALFESVPRRFRGLLPQ